MSSSFEGCYLGIISCITLQPQVDKQAIVIVIFGSSDLLTDYRQDSIPLLTGTLSDQLLDPTSEAANFRRGDQSHFVSSSFGKFSQDYTQASRIVLPHR